MATTVPVTIVEMCGVRKLGWMARVQPGIRPSFPIARKILGPGCALLRSVQGEHEGRRLVAELFVIHQGDIRMASVAPATDSGLAATPLVRTAFDERGGVMSADGRWLAYESDESGDWQVYLRPLTGGTRAVVGPSPSRDARWTADGVLADRSGGRIYEVSISETGAIGAPRPLIDMENARFADFGPARALLLRRPAAAAARAYRDARGARGHRANRSAAAQRDAALKRVRLTSPAKAVLCDDSLPVPTGPGKPPSRQSRPTW